MSSLTPATSATVLTTVEPAGPSPSRRKRRGRRGNREGCVAQRKDGSWYGYVSQDRGARKWYTGKTRQEVAAKVARGVRATESGLPIPPERGTVGQFLEAWLEDSVRMKVRPSTYSSYRGLVRRHLDPELGKVRLNRLTPEQVQRMLTRKLGEGLSSRGVDYIRAILRAALNHALRLGLVSRNVAGLTTRPRVSRREVEPLSVTQAHTLLEAVRGDRLEAMYSVALALGMRQGELLGLGWADVDFEGRTLSVRHSLQRLDGAFVLAEPKTARSRRRLGPLPGQLLDALRDHRARQNQEKLAARGWGNDWNLVFTTASGSPLHAADVIHAFQAHLAAAGLPKKRFHDLRHTCASFLLAQNVPARVVMDVLGHSQISLTLDTYSHVVAPMQGDAFSGLASTIFVS